MSVGTNIKKRRFELRMSQQDLADALGYKTRSTIAKIESGENDVTQKKLQRFAEVLDTTVESLVTGVSNHPASSFSSASTTPISSTTVAPLIFTNNDASAQGSRKRTVAVILAGGKSSRNQQNIPNQFINIHGKPVIVYCLEAYQAHPAVDDIYIVCIKGWEQIMSAYAEQYGISKLCGLIPGAVSGILSVKNALDQLQSRYAGSDLIIFQEATRPMVTVDTISKLLQATYESGSANICQAMKENVQFIYVNGKTQYIDRNTIVDLQSPEGYKFDLITEVFQKAKAEGHELSESCCAMLRYNLGYDINFIEGSVNNIKIVRQEDIAIFEALVKR